MSGVQYILIVEDDAVTQDIISYGLRQRGWNTASAYSTEEALETIESSGLPTLIIMDICFPPGCGNCTPYAQEGFILAHKIIKELDHKELPIIFLSDRPVYALETNLQEVDYTRWDHIPKYFEMDELQEKIKRLTTKESL